MLVSSIDFDRRQDACVDVTLLGNDASTSVYKKQSLSSASMLAIMKTILSLYSLGKTTHLVSHKK